jgi:hypothetical protein
VGPSPLAASTRKTAKIEVYVKPYKNVVWWRRGEGLVASRADCGVGRALQPESRLD